MDSDSFIRDCFRMVLSARPSPWPGRRRSRSVLDLPHMPWIGLGLDPAKGAAVVEGAVSSPTVAVVVAAVVVGNWICA